MISKLSAKYQLCAIHTADTIDGWRCQPSSRHLCFTGRRGSLPVKSQVVLLQTAHSWANAGVLLGARMQRISHASGAGELSKHLNFRRYVLCCFPTNRNSHARIGNERCTKNPLDGDRNTGFRKLSFPCNSMAAGKFRGLTCSYLKFEIARRGANT